MLIVTAYKFQHVLHPYLGIVGFFKANLYLLFRNVFPKTIGTEQYLHVPAQRHGLLHFRLRRLGLQVSLLPSGGSELLEGLSQAAENDLVVLFSFSKLSREGRILLEHSRAAGYRTLAFVGRTCLPAEERADISLFAYRGTEKEYHSMAAPAALLDALAVAVAERLGTEGTQRLESLHRMKKDYFPDG